MSHGVNKAVKYKNTKTYPRWEDFSGNLTNYKFTGGRTPNTQPLFVVHGQLHREHKGYLCLCIKLVCISSRIWKKGRTFY